MSGSISSTVKAIHLVSGELDQDGNPKNGAIIEIEQQNGGFISQVNPHTQTAIAGSRQQFKVTRDVNDDRYGILPVNPQMSHPAASNGGFRWQEISRAKFQETIASILGSHKQQHDDLVAKVKAQGEFMADMSMRMDEHAKTLSVHQGSFQAWGERNFMARLRWLFSGK